MARKKKLRQPKLRIPLPRKPPKVEHNPRREEQRRRCRRPLKPENENQ